MTHPALRTPDERFADLPGFDFEPHWFEWEGLRLHYVDEGTGPPVVLFHGQPTWSYLWRKVLTPIVAAGYRVIAPDYAGFGKSDKPTESAFYTYDRHVESMLALLDAIGLEDATAVVQDWGGPIGLRTAAERRDRFRRLVILNTGLFTGAAPNQAFMEWRAFVERTPDLTVSRVMRASAATDWPDEVLAAYDAPFPDIDYKTGVQRFPLIVPITTDDPGADEMREVLAVVRTWADPVLVMFSDSDPIFSVDVGQRFAAIVPGAGDLEVISGAAHFLQEDKGEEVGTRIAAFLDAS